MNFFSPLTLLIIPLLGSLYISFMNPININLKNSKYVNLLKNDKIGYDLSSFQSSKFTNNKIKQIILNTISLVFLGFLFYNFIFSLNIHKFYGIFISFVFSYLLTYFVLNIFKYFNKKK